MTANQNVPDPDRGEEDQVNTAEMPQIFQNGDSEDSDDDETPNTNGYELITQDDHEQDEEEDEDGGLSMEEQVAALVRAAQSDQNNLSDVTRELIEQSDERQRREIVAESVKVWADVKPREDSIKLDDDKVEAIKSLMSSFKLPQIPVWAAEIGDEVWKEKLGSQAKKS